MSGNPASNRRQGWMGWAVVLLCSIASASAVAHGPTVEISDAEMKPPLLNLFLGTTVHFVNKVEAPAGRRVVDQAGTIESPKLVKVGDGWHYTFETLGNFEVFLDENPGAKMRIVIVPKRATKSADAPGH